ncbi:Response regulator receiver domain-containing protein [Nocardioides szechwanensis]|uniref:histidine kinase n=1 Tax=Nocardioides szechwanensis TaxID=1005944 RepID=A0A1G9ZN48_9ACTN|nr:Response regulator receiver domain-containing protein [Nocardioides szechwanensis]
MSARSRSTRSPSSRTTALTVLDRRTDLRVLLIEDATTDCVLVRALLEGEFPNGDIEAATSLAHALDRLALADYDVVLVNLNLPEADGCAVVRAVRVTSPHTALMVLTGRGDGTLALWALAEGAQDYLVTGEHDGPRLADALLRGLQRSRTEQRAHAVLGSALDHESESAVRLRELTLAKSEFVATVSHELRTPLSSIAGYAEMLRSEGGLTTQQTRFVDAIARNATRLAVLTDDLLVVSSFSSAVEQLEPVAVDLSVVVAGTQEVIRVLGAGHQLDFVFELPDHPALVTGDAGHLERVVLNLVGNAIKFSKEHGRVTCRVSTSPSDVYLEVIDNGIGIPEDEQHELFTMFFRGSTARNRAVQGTGLGLHIVSSIVRHHHGEIDVQSGSGQGTTFTVRLPRRLRAA